MDTENKELAVTNNERGVLDFSDFRGKSNTQVGTFSNIKDSKKLFNLETHVDAKLNDCVGESIRVKEVLIKKYVKQMKEPVVDEETGEIIKDTETKIACILIDDTGKSYATGSKTFAYNMVKLLGDYDGEAMLNEGIDIKIIKVDVANSSNKALSFELI